jgi:hypothetical protein
MQQGAIKIINRKSRMRHSGSVQRQVAIAGGRTVVAVVQLSVVAVTVILRESQGALKANRGCGRFRRAGQ